MSARCISDKRGVQLKLNGNISVADCMPLSSLLKTIKINGGGVECNWCSSTSYQLHVPAHRLVYAGRRSFPVVQPSSGTLPSDVQSSTSRSVFQQRQRSYFINLFLAFYCNALSLSDYVSVVFVNFFLVILAALIIPD